MRVQQIIRYYIKRNQSCAYLKNTLTKTERKFKQPIKEINFQGNENKTVADVSPETVEAEGFRMKQSIS